MIIHSPRAHGLCWSRPALSGAAGRPGKRARCHGPTASYSILRGKRVFRCWNTTRQLPELFAVMTADSNCTSPGKYKKHMATKCI